jgi:intracellular sulfur oxidation DsrE/DsrF family protein
MPSRRDFLALAALGAAPPAFPDTGPLLAAPHRHRIAFGFTRVADGAGLGQMKNALNAYEFSRREGPGTTHVLGVFYGSAVALALGDAAWRTYRIGRALQLRGDTVSRSGAAAGNPFARGTPDASVTDSEDPRSSAQDASLAGLMRRGASFFVCNNALTGFARSLVTDGNVREPVDRVLTGLRGTMLPGTVLVPAGVAALNDAQEARYSYVSA